MSSDWCTIESDPGVFTELLETVGVKGVELDELWTLDDDTLEELQSTCTIHGLVFLFKWEPGQDTSLGSRTPLSPDEAPPDLFFAKQVVTNACATQAILSIVLNSQSLDLGPTLSDFKSFTSSFPPDLKGEAIGASAELQQAHNSFARKDAFLTEGRSVASSRSGTEDVFHFVAYIPFGDKIYELDGLQNGPICIGSADAEIPWYTVARSAIQQRMDATTDVKFNLMAVIGDRRQVLEAQIASGAPDAEGDLAAQHAKREQWKRENERRRHNYVPLCVELVKELARKGKLAELTEQAGERMRAKQLKKKA